MHIIKYIKNTFNASVFNTAFGNIEGGASESNTQQSKESKQNYKETKWYNELSQEQKDTIDIKIKENLKIKKNIENKKAELQFKGLKVDILTKGIEKNTFLIEDLEDKIEIKSFEEKIDMINRSIDLLSQELYILNLKLNSVNLSKNSKESNIFFKESFLKKGETNQTIIELIENKNLSNITAGEVYFLRQKGYDLSKIFLIGGKKEISKNSMNIGDSFTVNFGGNKELNKSIGAGDLLDISNIERVKINGIEGERKYIPRPGYYGSNGKYLAIFDNYKIEILSKSKLSLDENVKYEKSFSKRFEQIKGTEIHKKFRDSLNKNANSNIINLLEYSKLDLEYLNNFFKDGLSSELYNNLNLDINNKTLSTVDGTIILDFFNKELPFGIGFEKYKNITLKVASKYGIKASDLINLINHENGNWDPLVSAAGSSAYGLGQMIDSTWEIYGEGLNRSNAEHQLEATCKYLNAIMNNKNCKIEVAMAYYNTGEGIMSISNTKAKEYYDLNAPIANKIPKSENIIAKTYFIGAIAYYNNISYSEAKKYINLT